MNTTWVTSFSACCFHTAVSIIDGLPLMDSQHVDDIKHAMKSSVELLVSEIEIYNWPKQSLLQSLVALSGTIESNRELAETVLIKIIGRDKIADQVAPLTRCITAMESGFRKAVPAVIEELQLRLMPLQMQWEACGPGLLKMIATISDENLIAEDARIILVHPIIGGAGTAHLKQNCVTIEAVLTNVNDDLPEVLRLGWLLSQLNLDLPIYCENLNPATRDLTSALAMIPVILTAADNINLVKFDPSSIELAISFWHLKKSCPANSATTLQKWWTTYQASRPRWPVALAALQKMLFDASV